MIPVALADAPGNGPFDFDAAERTRAEQCLLNLTLRRGGQALKAVSRSGLNGSEAELHAAAESYRWQDGKTPLAVAWDQDNAWRNAKSSELGARDEVWEQSLHIPGQTTPPGYTVVDFEWVDNEDNPFHTTGVSAGLGALYFDTESDIYLTDQTPVASQESVDAVNAIAAARYSEDRREDGPALDALKWDMTFMHPMYADDARIFLQHGGFPTTAPAPDSMEFRLDVEALKARFASCATHNPIDPYNVLGAEVALASVEWQNELSGQKAQRAVIMDAEAKASRHLGVASQAMAEALAQSLIANRLTDWQAHWLKQPPNSTMFYPTPAEFAEVKTNIERARERAQGRVFVAGRAALAAQVEAARADKAKGEAYAVADAAGLPRGRGLMYGQQAVQVAKASAAAAQAAFKATETAANATRASAADSKTLMALAETQAHASKAEFRRKAAEEAAAQAKAAAEGAAYQAKLAAENATKAKDAENRAKAAEAEAKTAAAAADAKRKKAEAEAVYAKSQKELADAERGKASTAEAKARAERKTAADQLAAAQVAGTTAATKKEEALAAEAKASKARDGARDAERRRDGLVAKAEAAEALFTAVDGTAAAIEARDAATKARTAADKAMTAAVSARSAADQATEAATNAREAATRAEGAAKRAQALADGAKRDVAITEAAVKTAHADAAEAIDAAGAAKWNAVVAKAEAETAQLNARKAKADAAASRSEANLASGEAARTVGFAYATAQAAKAAGESAQQVIKPANDAIELGAPYRETDSSAGLAVLTGQAAKTVASQQAALAKAKAEQAAAAAKQAKKIAEEANADAKAAAEAAAQAAASSAQALASAAAAQSSANNADASAKAAQQSEANTVKYHQEALEDAAAAQSSADTAAGYADQADAAATEAEQDAASARSSANSAETDAGTARNIADRAERDAVTAETAAKNARNLAVEAVYAAVRTENETDEVEREQERSETGPVGIDGVVMRPSDETLVDIDPKSDCVGTHSGGEIGCEIDLEYHIYGEMDFYLESCPIAGVSRAKCGNSIKRDYLMSAPLDVRFRENKVHVDGLELTASVLKALATGALQDLLGCARLELGSCLWLAGTIVIPPALSVAARAALAVRVAMRSGVGLGAAIWALRGSGLAPQAVAVLEQAGRTALKGFCFPAGTMVATEYGSRPIETIKVGDRVWSEDPLTGKRQLRKVTDLFRRTADSLVTVHAGHDAVRATPEHPFWAVGRGWTPAERLKPGDRLKSLDGSVSSVRSVSRSDGAVEVFNFAVENDHTYFVGSGQVLVHNACRLFPNKYPGALAGELAQAERLAIRPAKPGTAEFDRYIDFEGSGEAVKWAVLEDGRLLVMPKTVAGQELSHPVLTGGAAVQAAGEATIAGSGGHYMGLQINSHSGHFFVSGDPFWAAGGGAEILGREAFAAHGVLF
ncbi:polymorphic toxin-type HINT domain-containing protein [Streptomyces cinereoruber]|uniref:polymorphic toxin-type HINT domain-containing protein n=1 Tax=Streptomyces cinereoruber TaxID=67260 RepID=UPI003C2C8DDA